MSAEESPIVSVREAAKTVPSVEDGTAPGESKVSEFSPLEIPATPPAVLWHYTDAAGVLGILGNKREKVSPEERPVNTQAYGPIFHATMAEYLNDSRELLHGLEIFRAWLQVIMDGRTSLTPKIRTYLGDLCEAIQKMSAREYIALMHCHVVSFSERGDVLSQWRGYGGGTGGFAIGFDTRAFPHSDGSGMHRAGVGLHQVRYLDEASLDGPLAAVIDLFISQISEDAARWPDRQTPSRVNRALRSLGVVAASIKHPGFKEEKEWRFIEPAFLDPVKFRPGRTGLVPYRAVKLGTELCVPADAVTGVVVGPGPLQHENKLAAESMLQSFGYCRAAGNVVCSSTPFR